MLPEQQTYVQRGESPQRGSPASARPPGLCLARTSHNWGLLIMAGTSSSRSHRRLLVIGQPPMTDAEARIAAARRRQARASAAPSGTSVHRSHASPLAHRIPAQCRRSVGHEPPAVQDPCRTKPEVAQSWCRMLSPDRSGHGSAPGQSAVPARYGPERASADIRAAAAAQ